MITENTQKKLRGFALNLVTLNLIDKKTAQLSLKEAYSKHIPFIHFLYQQKTVASNKIADVASHYFGIPLLDGQKLNTEFIPHDLLEHVPSSQRAYILPLFKRGKTLFVAIADPTISALNEIKFSANLNVTPILVNAEKLTKLTANLFEEKETEALNELVEDADLDKLEIAVEKGRKQNKKIKLGICGEHGGDPKSIHFCAKVGLDYVSCSPYRVPIARLAAAQAELFKKN